MNCHHGRRLFRLLVAGFLGSAFGISLTALPAFADLKVTPYLTVSEQYDSNITFTSGGDNHDFVTIVSPGLSANYRGRPLEASLSGSVSLAAYAEHSDFNNVAASGTLSVNLNQLVGRLDKRARLQIGGSVLYTPELPAFIRAGADSTPFAIGIQPQRVRTFSYGLSATGGYSLTPRVDLTGSYSYAFVNFGGTVGAPAETALFRTTSQGVSVGPEVKLTPVDTVSLQFIYQKVGYGGGALEDYHTKGGTVGLTHIFSPQLTVGVSAGATIISSSDRVVPLATVTVSWNERNTTTTLAYSRSVTPSFLIAAGSLESHLVSLSVVHKLTELLTATASVNYARSSSASATGTTGNLSFDSYGADFTLSHPITRWISASFAYSHSRFSQGFSAATSTFDRDTVTFSVTATWM